MDVEPDMSEGIVSLCIICIRLFIFFYVSVGLGVNKDLCFTGRDTIT